MSMRLILAFMALSFTAALAEPSSSPPKLTQTCVACHGQKGTSAAPLWPNLAGQKADYMIKQLKDFKEGRRQDPLMSPIAKSLDEQDMKTLAQYYGSL